MNTVPQTVVIQSKSFRDAFVYSLNREPVELTEDNLVNMMRRVVDIVLDDGEISEMQLRYEAGRLVGTLLAACGR